MNDEDKKGQPKEEPDKILKQNNRIARAMYSTTSERFDVMTILASSIQSKEEGTYSKAEPENQLRKTIIPMATFWKALRNSERSSIQKTKYKQAINGIAENFTITVPDDGNIEEHKENVFLKAYVERSTNSAVFFTNQTFEKDFMTIDCPGFSKVSRSNILALSSLGAKMLYQNLRSRVGFPAKPARFYVSTKTLMVWTGIDVTIKKVKYLDGGRFNRTNFERCHVRPIIREINGTANGRRPHGATDIFVTIKKLGLHNNADYVIGVTPRGNGTKSAGQPIPSTVGTSRPILNYYIDSPEVPTEGKPLSVKKGMILGTEEEERQREEAKKRRSAKRYHRIYLMRKKQAEAEGKTLDPVIFEQKLKKSEADQASTEAMRLDSEKPDWVKPEAKPQNPTAKKLEQGSIFDQD